MPPKKIFAQHEELEIPVFDDPKKIEKMVKKAKKPKSSKPKIPKTTTNSALKK